MASISGLNSSKTGTDQIALYQARNHMAEHKADIEYNKNDSDIEVQRLQVAMSSLALNSSKTAEIAYQTEKENQSGKERSQPDVEFKESDSENLLLRAAAEGRIKLLKSLLPESSISAINQALSVATKNNQIRAVKLILQFGGNPINYNTLSAPLYDAASKCKVKMLTLFCQGFIDVNAISKGSGSRAIDYALESTRCSATEDERMNALTVLVSYGADKWEDKALKMGVSAEDINIINCTAVGFINSRLNVNLSLLYEICPLPRELIYVTVRDYLLPPNYAELINTCRKSQNADKETSAS